MLNKFRVILIISIFVFISYVVKVDAADLIFETDTTITIGTKDYIIASGSTATSFTVDTTFISITMPSNAILTFKSPDKYILNNTYGSVNCEANNSVLILNQTGTFTITPDTNSVWNSGGGTVSAGSSPSNSNSVVTSLIIEPVVIPPILSNIFSDKVNEVSASKITNTAPIYNLGNSVLKNGSKGESVKELQKFLNNKLNLNLKIDGKLGPKTISVIKKWQKDNGL